MNSLRESRRELALLAVTVGYGLLVFQVGFKLTGEVLPILALLALGGFVVGIAAPRRAWLCGLGIGIGTRLLPEPPLSEEHIRHEGPSHPLPLPFNLTESAFAQWLVLSLVIMAFPLFAAIVGAALRKLVMLTTNAARTT